MKVIFKLFVFSSFLLLSSCGITNKEGGGFNIFTIEQDQQLGLQVATEINSQPNQYPILDSAAYPKAYEYLYEMRNTILNSGNVRHKNDFKWQLKIIHDDSTLNAFCTPGGYIYVYTGLIKFLDAEDQLAGVLAHEIAHADYRHSTRQMTQMYGVQILLQVLAGDRAALQQITSSLVGLKFSRNHETEADRGSVMYLCPTQYNAAGGAEFFKKIEELGGGRTPEFLSTHPSPTNRIEHFHEVSVEQGCEGTSNFKERYQKFIKTLP